MARRCALKSTATWPAAARAGTSRAVVVLVASFTIFIAVALAFGIAYWQRVAEQQRVIDELKLAGATINFDGRGRVIGVGLSKSDLAVSLPQLSRLPEVYDVSAIESNFSDSDLKFLKHNFKLEILEIPDTNVTGIGFSELRGLRELSVIRVSGCPISVQGMEQISLLPSLKILTATRMVLTAEHLDAMGGSHVEFLNLSESVLDVPALERLLKAGEIRRILLGGTNLSLAEIERLQASAHSVEIITD